MDISEDILYKEIYPDEALLTALFYMNPSLYEEYDESKLSYKHFGNKIWAFYFKLGRFISDRGGEVIDDITVSNVVNELKLRNKYEEYNEFETITELIEEVKNKENNEKMYYDNIKKYHLLREFRELFGDKVIEDSGNYKYKLLNAEQIANYWLYKIENITLNNVDNGFEEQFLLEDLDKEIEIQNIEPEIGMPFCDSKLLTRQTNGLINGELYIFGGFGGKGKTSFTIAKVISSCIIHNEKLVVIANEEGIRRYRRNLLITVMGNFTNESFPRYRINEGKFTDDEYQKLQRAKEWIDKITKGNNKLITFVFMENYVMKDVQKIIKHYAKKSISKFLIDTGKPSEGKSHGEKRWEILADDMKDLYKLCRTNGGGLGISIWVNCQLADSALKTRFLNEYALGDSKKMKNEASVLYLMRPCWDDELEGGGRELKCFKWVKPKTGNQKYIKEEFSLDRFTDCVYYVLFIAKNRLGQSSETGAPCIVFKTDFNKNKWEELGQAFLINDHKD